MGGAHESPAQQSRFLFVVPPLTGHVNPTISVGRELTRRGHAVAWTGVPGKVEALLPRDAHFLPSGHDEPTAERSPGLRTAAAFKFLWEQALLPLAFDMVDGVDAAVDDFQPDVLVVDQYALAGAAVAVQRELVWATSATTSAGVVDPLAELPMVQTWVDQQLAGFKAAVGGRVAGASSQLLQCSDQLVLVFSTRRLVGEDLAFPDHYAFIGPALSGRPDPQPFPWGWLDPDRAHVLVSLGTVNVDAGERFFAVAAEALADEPLQAILVTPERPAGTADNLLVQQRVPQLSLLPHLDAVVSHGGHNTVCETLAHGLPLVVAPIRDDQPIVADQVARSGAGIRVRFGRVRPAELREAVHRVLAEPSYREAAAGIQRSFRTAGGAAVAADRLEALIASARAEDALTT